MKLNVYLTPFGALEEKLKDHTAVVVDVLRASTTICAALGAGAKEVVPAESTSTAIQLASLLSRDTSLLCGEREGLLIEGFDLGNSPYQYKPAIVKGKTLIFSSTNGTPTILKTRLAKRTLICGFVNLDLVVRTLSETEGRIDILCSGKLNHFAIEDAVCAGLILRDLQRKTGEEYELNDGATAALILAERYSDSIVELVSNSHHGRYLAKIGMEADLPFCADLNKLPLLPVFNDGRITIAR